MTNCAVTDCKRAPIFNGKCALHCPKDPRIIDEHHFRIRTEFKDSLESCLLEQVFLAVSSNRALADISRDHIYAFVRDRSGTNAERIRQALSDVTLNLKGFIFPDSGKEPPCEWANLFANCQEKVIFSDCEFWSPSFSTTGQILFQGCRFKRPYRVMPQKVIPTETNALFISCKFDEDVYASSESGTTSSIEQVLLSGCDLASSLRLERKVVSKPVVQDIPGNPTKIRQVEISECTFKANLSFANGTFEGISISRCKFEGSLSVKRSKGSTVKIEFTEIEGALDFFQSIFDKFRFFKTTFHSVAEFEGCILGSPGAPRTAFRYATFLGLCNFRDAQFKSGLSVASSTFVEPPTFLGAALSYEETDRETYRLIKHSFDRVANYTEGNKFFSLEMRKLLDETDRKSSFQKWLVLKANQLVSDFGQSILRPSIWIVVLGFFYLLVRIGYEKNIVYDSFPWLSPYFLYLSNVLNAFANAILPFSRFLDEGTEFLGLLTYCLLAACIWQLIVAIKRFTRR